MKGNGNSAAERKFGISEKIAGDWRKTDDTLGSVQKYKRALGGEDQGGVLLRSFAGCSERLGNGTESFTPRNWHTPYLPKGQETASKIGMNDFQGGS